MREQRVAIGLPGEAQRGFAHRRLGRRIIQDRADRGGDRVGIAVDDPSRLRPVKQFARPPTSLMTMGVPQASDSTQALASPSDSDGSAITSAAAKMRGSL